LFSAAASYVYNTLCRPHQTHIKLAINKIKKKSTVWVI
jgi:hypothetical protein